MGCAASLSKTKVEEQHSNLHVLKAAVLIQKWFRRHQARLEARRRCTWKIFQAIEYSGEQDQVKLCNFFNDLLSNQRQRTIDEKRDHLLDMYADPVEIELDETYSGPKVSIPIDLDTISEMVDYFQKGNVLHVKYVLLILHEVRDKLKQLPNITKTTTAISHQITICGDLHGSFDDLLTIFQKNSPPSHNNPYIFNGDLVDRGAHSIEVVLTIFSFFLLYSNNVFINRGNHEDLIMSSRYGFLKEIIKKYKKHASKIIRVMDDVFSWLPLATIVDDEIFVVHGGVSNLTNLEFVETIKRHKYVSVLKPDFIFESGQLNDMYIGEWRQILDLLWSDPCLKRGCTANTFRGVGCYFGPDVTNEFLQRYKLKLLVRSHECVFEGYEMTHSGKVITVFSASDYYESGSNNGAYMKILPKVEPYFVQYTVSESSAHQVKEMSFVDRVSKVEESAIRELTKIIFSRKDELLQEFNKRDPGRTGHLTVLEWISVMENVLEISLPWIMIINKMSIVKEEGKINYESSLQRYHIELMFCLAQKSVVEKLYRHRNTLETIFSIIDKDKSGFLSPQEFKECCQMLCEHTKCLSEQEIKDLISTMDINNDGKIDFNEFLETFRLSMTSHTE